MIDPEMIELLVRAIETRDCDCTTPVTRVATTAALFDPNIVKVVRAHDGTALYFSRNPIPCVRDFAPEECIDRTEYLRHIGVYAFRSGALERFVMLPPSTLERAEQ